MNPYLEIWLAFCAVCVTVSMMVTMIAVCVIASNCQYVRTAVKEYAAMLGKLNGADWAKEHIKLWNRNKEIEKRNPNIEMLGVDEDRGIYANQ